MPDTAWPDPGCRASDFCRRFARRTRMGPYAGDIIHQHGRIDLEQARKFGGFSI
jgi:hypothetical protein